LAGRNAAHGRALEIAEEVVTDPALHEAIRSLIEAVREAAADGIKALDAVRTIARDAARESVPGMVLLEAKWAARDAILKAAGGLAEDSIWSAAYYVITDDSGALTEAAHACAERNVLAAFNHPAQQRLVESALPMVDAFEAGLFFFWITPSEVIWVPRPVLSIADGRLHREDGPAVEWATGERYWFWRGTLVPQWVIEDPSSITPAAIRAETNQDIRRCMQERVGGGHE
jgi:hypothetical protein